MSNFGEREEGFLREERFISDTTKLSELVRNGIPDYQINASISLLVGQHGKTRGDVIDMLRAIQSAGEDASVDTIKKIQAYFQAERIVNSFEDELDKRMKGANWDPYNVLQVEKEKDNV